MVTSRYGLYECSIHLVHVAPSASRESLSETHRVAISCSPTTESMDLWSFNYSDIKRVRRNTTENPDSDLKHKKPYYGYYNSPDFRIISVYHPIIDDIGATGFDYVTVNYQSKGGCDDIILYFDNIFDNSIVVYDYVKDDFWMFANHSSFVPVPSESYILDQYQLSYGVMNIALGWPDKKGNRIAYYAPGASTGEYAVTTKTLKNRRKQPPYGNEFRLIGYHGCKGSIHRQFFDPNCGVMFFAHMASGEVRCWNVGKPFNPNNLEVIFHPEEFELFSDVYVDSEGYLWMHSCQVHLALGTDEPLDLSRVNSRIRKVKVLDAIEGTVCENYGGLQHEVAWEYLSDL
ncbi:L-dopachrome tautomerase yellow-f2-like [Phlebotomus papatasi]|uniref:L-dopachrome tautomerase yellow-f2-like n=1 Tax=Phlebotomus papatasi TaxID=29031 RepID=UPI002483E7D8|nr:L-dopachrome tautomerase yellow-f2-like [Phlebotomus papatasi]